MSFIEHIRWSGIPPVVGIGSAACRIQGTRPPRGTQDIFSVHHRFDEKIIRTFNRVNQSLGYRWTVYKVYNKLFHVVNIFSQFRLCKCWYGQWDDPGSENDQINNCLKPISKKMKTWAKNTSFSPGAFTSSEKVLRAPTQRVQAPLRPEFLQMSAGCVVGAP